MLRYGTLSTPIGPIAVAWRDGDVVVAVHMAHADHPGAWDTGYRGGGPVTHLRESLAARFGTTRPVRVDDGVPLGALARYFDGALDALDTLAVDPGGTRLQAELWRHLRTIPAGSTMSYGALARAVGRPGASRAAGRAVGTNPIPLVIPCHRIVGADGQLTGFGGGLERKRWLLRHERALGELV
jgi:methylated-DNA-[protein]-cysteine S-methyltransferase